MDFTLFVYLIAGLFSCFIAGVLLGAFSLNARAATLMRSRKNPILKPTQNVWENKAVFNPAAIVLDGRTHLLYRAIGDDGISRFGYASSTDGITFDVRLTTPAYQVEYPRVVGAPLHAQYGPTLYASGGSWGGCEDPRLVLIDGKIYLIYYAFDEDDMVRITVTTISQEDFVAHRFDKWEKPFFISPPHHMHKNWLLFPEKLSGKFAVLHSIIGDTPEEVRIEYTDDLASLAKRAFQSPDPKKAPDASIAWHMHVRGAGPTPIKTDHGWLVLYHAHDKDEPTRYKWGALLLDLQDPKKVLARSLFPIFEPNAPYENDWKPGVAYACGATVVGGKLFVYYGSGEMTVSVASVPLNAFVRTLVKGQRPSFVRELHLARVLCAKLQAIATLFQPKPLLTRSKDNPILSPQGEGFEASATFNAAAIDLGGSVHILYRAMSTDHISTIGYARSTDGQHIDERLREPAYRPRRDFEQKHSHLNSGCEDPRTVLIDDRLYMTYVAAGSTNEARGAITSIPREDFLAKRFDAWAKPSLVTIDGIDDKDICLLPRKIHNNYVLYHRIKDRICAALIYDLSFTERVSKCLEVLAPQPGGWDSEKVGIAGPPIKIEGGWLMIYHGIGKGGTYGLGAALLDPSGLVVRKRLTTPLLVPEALYEKHGERNDVVFSCGHIVRDDTLYLYYGAGDKVLALATGSLSRIVNALS
jgi:predicted GH43/DUF377 family glycosyl hydrolase